MNVAFLKPMTQAEFFDWAQNHDGPCEFDGFQPVAMVGGTMAHGTIADNIRAQLNSVSGVVPADPSARTAELSKPLGLGCGIPRQP